jgi:hypothetical protein
MTRARQKAVNVVMMGEYGTDPDEKLSLILASWLARKGYIRLLAVIGNHLHALLRAQDAKFTLSELAQPFVPVGMGEHGFGSTSKHTESDPLFLAPAYQIQRGRELLRWTLEQAEDRSVVLVLNSGFTDAVWLWMDAPDLFKKKVQRVIIMGGVEIGSDNLPRLNSEALLVPSLGASGAANNCFDPGATLHMYDLLQRHGIPMVITTRYAAYGCMMPFRIYEELATTNHVIGQRLNEAQCAAIDGLWKRANAPEGSEERDSLPADRDRAWFVSRFCGGEDPPIDGHGDIVPFMSAVALYDPMNLIAAVPELLERFYSPYSLVTGRGPFATTHQIVGVTEENHGVADEAGLRRFMLDGMVYALQHGMAPIAVPS